MTFNKIDALKLRHGEENYRCAYRGRVNNLQYHITKTADGIFGVKFEAFDIEGAEPRLAGLCSIIRVNGTGRDPRSFLLLPDIPCGKNIWEPFVETYDRGEGLALRLLEEILREMQEKKGMAVASFTQEGRTYMLDKFVRLGYNRCKIKEDAKIPKWVQGLSDWMYFDYGTNPLPSL